MGFKSDVLRKLDALQEGQARTDNYLLALEKIMSAMDDKIGALQASVANLTTVDSSVLTMLNGIGAQITAAVNAALAAGATPVQLQSMTDLGAAINGQSTALAAAVAANTPTPPAAPPPTTKPPPAKRP